MAGARRRPRHGEECASPRTAPRPTTYTARGGSQPRGGWGCVGCAGEGRRHPTPLRSRPPPVAGGRGQRRGGVPLHRPPMRPLHPRRRWAAAHRGGDRSPPPWGRRGVGFSPCHAMPCRAATINHLRARRLHRRGSATGGRGRPPSPPRGGARRPASPQTAPRESRSSCLGSPPAGGQGAAGRRPSPAGGGGGATTPPPPTSTSISLSEDNPGHARVVNLG